MDQLEKIGQQLELPVYVHRGATDVLKIAREALDFARANNRNTLIFDTAGRLQIDEPLVQELVRLRDLVKPQEVLLVLDATTGQNGMQQARVFSEVVAVTGIVLTKLDGTAKGGIVIAVQQELGVPVKLIGLGEGPDDLAPFEPEAFVDALLAPDPGS